MENKPKHTLGNWEYGKICPGKLTPVQDDDGTVYTFRHELITSGRMIIAEVKFCSKDSGYESVKNIREFEANCALISAAPELLALCKEVIEAVDLDGQNRKELRKALQSAIAKAED